MIVWCWLVTGGLLVNAIRLRRRLTGLKRLPGVERLPTPAEGLADLEDEPYELVAAEDVEVPAGTERAAVAYARDHSLGVLDLVPADLPVERALDLARVVDPDAYRNDRIGLGRGAGHALVAERGLLKKAGAETSPGPGELTEMTVGSKQYATGFGGRGTPPADLVVAELPARRGLADRRTWLTALCLMVPQSLAAPRLLATSMVGYVLVLGGLLIDPLWALLPIAVYSATPYLVFAGSPIRPRDLHLASWLRVVTTPLSWWSTLRAPRTSWEEGRLEEKAASRVWHQDQLGKGTARFFEARRDTCPWCGSSALSVHVRVRDTLLAKPGRFTLERCADCGHVFQNPRLSSEGLDFYYRDVYDGLGAANTELIFSSQGGWYRDRAELVAAHAKPANWLDVGGGHGHFCAVAAEILPETVFDALDLSEGIEEAERRGWVRRSYRGLFPELAAGLAGRYEAVSMHHYLEHTIDPLAELDAAVRVLAPGGHLMIELPDPEAWTGRLLRGFWIAWLPPQHLNMMPLRNLLAALADRGLEVVSAEYDGVRVEPEFTSAAIALVNTLGPDPRRPWAPPATFGGQVRRVLAYAAGVPIMCGAILADLAVHLVRPKNSNSYRVLARLPG